MNQPGREVKYRDRKAEVRPARVCVRVRVSACVCACACVWGGRSQEGFLEGVIFELRVI